MKRVWSWLFLCLIGCNSDAAPSVRPSSRTAESPLTTTAEPSPTTTAELSPITTAGPSPLTTATLAPSRMGVPDPEGPLPKLDLAMASPRTVVAGLPARFGAALASTYRKHSESRLKFAPETYVTRALCLGDEGMQRRVLESWRTAAKEKEEPQRFNVGNTACEKACRWAISVAESVEEPQVVRDVAAHKLEDCRVPMSDLKRVMSAKSTPAEAVAAWLSSLDAERVEVGYLPSMKRVLEHAAAGTPAAIRIAAVTVGRTADPRVARLLLGLHARLKTPAARRQAAYGMYAQTDGKARALFEAACKVHDDPICGLTKSAPKSLAARVRAHDFDAVRFLRQSGNAAKRDELITTLRACVQQRPYDGKATAAYQAVWCLTTLCKIDWARAKKEAAAASSEVHERLDGSLQQFASPDDIVAQLRKRGFVLAPPPADEVPTSVIEALRLGKRSRGFDTETGSFPNYHDELLYELAALAGKELEDVVFEEIFPADPDSREDYELRAYMSGTHNIVGAKNLGDWYDVEAVLGLLNHLLRARKSTWRYAAVATGGQDVIVVVAPEMALARAARDGLLDLAVTSSAADAGRAFEREVLE